MSLATRTTVERALGYYIAHSTIEGVSLGDFPATFKGAPGDEVPLAIHCICGALGENGEIPEEWAKLPMPAVVVACARSEPHLVGYDMCDVTIAALTTAEEIDAPAKVQARVGWISALFDEDLLDDIPAELNAPVSGPDERAVKGLQMIGLERAGEDYQENGRQITSFLKLRVHAIGLPVDPNAEPSPDTFLL